MQISSVTPPLCGTELSKIAIETQMLELFAPLTKRSADCALAHRTDNSALWRSDAIHRAKNLAQMVLSLAHLAESPSRCWLSENLVAQTRSLARVYDELSVDTSEAAAVPCAPLLIEVATRLTAIFGEARGIEVQITADPVSLAPDMRRALILLCSELLINALKYAYPADKGGTIRVCLTAGDGVSTLDVEDDGLGLLDDQLSGQGSRLLDQLGGVLGATLTRSAGAHGHGLHVRALVYQAAEIAVTGRAPVMAMPIPHQAMCV